MRDDIKIIIWSYDPANAGPTPRPDWLPFCGGRGFAVGIDFTKLELLLRQPIVPDGARVSPPKVMQCRMTGDKAVFMPIAFADTSVEAEAIARMADQYFKGLARAEPLYASVKHDPDKGELLDQLLQLQVVFVISEDIPS